MKSIIIPVFNQHDFTDECILSILDNTSDCEIVIVDNGSTPPYKPPFTGFIETTVIRNGVNKGFPIAVNQGIRAANGDVIILLNNDVIVTPGWGDKLEAWLNNGFNIVGPMTNFCAGFQKTAIDGYSSKDELYKAAGFYSDENKGCSEKVRWVIGFCMAFRKSLFDEIGEFDESIWPCSGEEIDFCFRAGEAGYSIGIAYDIYVHHEGSLTFKDMEAAGTAKYEDICTQCDLHLAEKWGNDFTDQRGQTLKPAELPNDAIKLNLGSGYDPQAGYINIDNRAEVNPDLVCDVIKGLPYKDNSVDEVRAHDFLEHIPQGKTIQVITEIWRVLKPGAVFDSFTPDAEQGQGFYQDPTHRSPWVENSWLYFSDPDSRNLYGIAADFEIKIMERIETSDRVFHLRVIAKARK